MSCLYCGKEIGPIQLLRGDEFCSPAHRKSYRERLGKALLQACQPEPAPVRAAGFADQVRPAPGNPSRTASFQLISKTVVHGARLQAGWRLGVPAVLGGAPRRLKPAEPAERASRPPLALCPPLGLGGEKSWSGPSAGGVLRFALDVSRDEAPGPRAAEPPPEARAQAVPSAEPAARLARPYAVEPRMAAFPLALPGFAVQTAEHGPEIAHPFGFLRPPAPEPAMREVREAASLAPVRGSGERTLHLPAMAPLRPVFDTASRGETAERAPASPIGVPLSESGAGASIALAPLRWNPRWNLAFPRNGLLPKAAGATPATLPQPGFFPPGTLAAPRPGQYTRPAATPLPTASRTVLPQGLEMTVAPSAPRAEQPAGKSAPAARDRAAAPITRDVIYATEIPAQAPAWKEPGPVQESPAMPVSGFAALAGALALAQASPVVAAPEKKTPRRPVSLPALPIRPILDMPALPEEEQEEEELTVDPPCEAGFLALEYHSHSVRGSRIPALEWFRPRLSVRFPERMPEPILPRLEDLAPQKTKNRRPAPVVTMPARPSRSTRAVRAVSALAAGLFVGVGIWATATAVRVGSGGAVVHQESSQSVADAGSAAVSAAVDWAPGRLASGDSPQKAKGPLGWLRESVAKRATMQVADTFATGMEAWGAPAKSWAPGWTRNRDGYVKPGPLALFRPSLAMQNYRLEFSAQIEKKSMGWVIRARDKQNYVAMKFTVVEAGLRPVIAAVRYPVVNGKRGRKVETPLSLVMVHNNEPYRVAVEVRGSRVTTSIEGQAVDSWTDALPAAGAVGFFADAGEQARLYWMKLAANDDFLGRVCGFVSEALGQRSSRARVQSPGPAGPAAPAQTAAAAANVLAFSRKRRKQSWEC